MSVSGFPHQESARGSVHPPFLSVVFRRFDIEQRPDLHEYPAAVLVCSTVMDPHLFAELPVCLGTSYRTHGYPVLLPGLCHRTTATHPQTHTKPGLEQPSLLRSHEFPSYQGRVGTASSDASAFSRNTLRRPSNVHCPSFPLP